MICNWFRLVQILRWVSHNAIIQKQSICMWAYQYLFACQYAFSVQLIASVSLYVLNLPFDLWIMFRSIETFARVRVLVVRWVKMSSIGVINFRRGEGVWVGELVLTWNMKREVLAVRQLTAPVFPLMFPAPPAPEPVWLDEMLLALEATFCSRARLFDWPAR